MYTFSIRKDHIPMVEITIDDNIIREGVYLQNLIEKCFEKVFQIIIKEGNDPDEIDFEED